PSDDVLPRGDPRVDWSPQPGGVHAAGASVPALEGLRPDRRPAQRAARRLDAPVPVAGPAPQPLAAVVLLLARRHRGGPAAGPAAGDHDGDQPEGEPRARPPCEI